MGEIARILIADDHDVVRIGIREYLEGEPDFDIVAEARDGAETLAKVEALRPDVVVMDIQMPVVSGVEATEIIKKRYPSIKILVLTGYDGAPYAYALLKAGDSGYLLKTADPEDLVLALRAVVAGQSWFGPQVADRVAADVRSGRLRDTSGAAGIPLTRRELEVLRLVAGGKTEGGIARALKIGEARTQGHLATIMAKLGASSRSQAVLTAVRLGWIGLEEATEAE